MDDIKMMLRKSFNLNTSNDESWSIFQKIMRHVDSADDLGDYLTSKDKRVDKLVMLIFDPAVNPSEAKNAFIRLKAIADGWRDFKESPEEIAKQNKKYEFLSKVFRPGEEGVITGIMSTLKVLHPKDEIKNWTEQELALTTMPWGETVSYVAVHDPQYLLMLKSKGCPGMDSRQKKAVERAAELIYAGKIGGYRT
ncbi:MAG: hypothetical protein WCP55_03725 [Lentisphaerota bacterium]